MTSKPANLNAGLVRAMVLLTLLAFVVVYGGLVAYFFFIYDWLYPEGEYDSAWQLGDTITLGLLLGIGILTASILGWRLARYVTEPLKSVASAARTIARGDFSARAVLPRRSFGEAGELVSDFNLMAERLERAETELKYSNSAIAHELRTPLTILRGRLQGLLDGAFQPTPQLYHRLIAHVDDLGGIVEELRTLALSNAGQLDLQYSRLDLASEVAAAADSMEDDLSIAGSLVVRRLKPAVTMADKPRLRQAIVALLDNCRRYAPHSTVYLETWQDKDYVYFRCTDTGPGLADESRNRAFERFWRADDSRNRVSGGSGLGLPIVKAIMQTHGGDAVILPTEGRGFSIDLRLPRREEAPV
ncbi:ATP-binding protein [Agrobacterium fabrum]|uniref:ATP-binding protein n=1 Tax=Agrobacterium fabrum TaxID=1176649 RepID=UPI0008911550|nr:ATP-binding protein [Agrobacterium fabrum]AYM60683.1 two-component system, OmpR family, sensor histidine kinase AdeS [Agrobacterium fabrum]MCR6727623.1 ATP-binding protein [Agrobacterium fabrum]NSZ15002.1 HAMP domain-containing protein [Agrobacterium fabrum]WIE30708.1 ATP-binding protein [Agrobacterium fabrum]WIE46655.1 ATP-binding protein [Agrobacterium fabrum]